MVISIVLCEKDYCFFYIKLLFRHNGTLGHMPGLCDRKLPNVISGWRPGSWCFLTPEAYLPDLQWGSLWSIDIRSSSTVNLLGSSPRHVNTPFSVLFHDQGGMWAVEHQKEASIWDYSTTINHSSRIANVSLNTHPCITVVWHEPVSSCGLLGESGSH